MANPFDLYTEVSRIDELLACNERIPSIELYQHRMKSAKSSSSTCSFSSSSSTSTVYIDDDKVFYNLILKETFELEQRRWQAATGQQDGGGTLMSLLSNQLRHSILSWMLDICVIKEFQDDIFPYATMIFDKFLLTRPIVDSSATNKTTIEQFNELQDDGLRLRQLYQYAACSLLISTKMRQTKISSKNFIDELVEFSRARLEPIGLTGDEIRQAEYLMLFTLNWDYALVTPNDYLPLLMRKCEKVLSHYFGNDESTEDNDNRLAKMHEQIEKSNHAYNWANGNGLISTRQNGRHQHQQQQQSATTTTIVNTPISSSSSSRSSCSSSSSSSSGDSGMNMYVSVNGTNNNDQLIETGIQQMISSTSNRRRNEDESQIMSEQMETNLLEQTQELIELCLMDSQLSQYSPSILAMSSMAVAISGLTDKIEVNTTTRGWILKEITSQIHESTLKVNELEQMIDVAFKIEKYVRFVKRFGVAALPIMEVSMRITPAECQSVRAHHHQMVSQCGNQTTTTTASSNNDAKLNQRKLTTMTNRTAATTRRSCYPNKVSRQHLSSCELKSPRHKMGLFWKRKGHDWRENGRAARCLFK